MVHLLTPAVVQGGVRAKQVGPVGAYHAGYWSSDTKYVTHNFNTTKVKVLLRVGNSAEAIRPDYYGNSYLGHCGLIWGITDANTVWVAIFREPLGWGPENTWYNVYIDVIAFE